MGIASVQCREGEDGLYKIDLMSPPAGDVSVAVYSESGMGQQVVRRGVD